METNNNNNNNNQDFSFEDIVENTDTCIKVFNKDGKIIFLNKGGRIEHSVKTGNDIQKFNWLSTVDDKYKLVTEKAFNEALNGKEQRIEYKHKPEGSNHEWCLGNISPIINRNGEIKNILFYSFDITDLKKAEEKLEEVKKRNQLILDFSAEGILGLDTEGKHTFVNKAAGRLLGWDPKELIGKGSHAIWHHTRADGTSFPKEECPIYAAYKDAKTHHGTDEIFWKKDGSSFIAEYVSTPILEKGIITGAVVVFSDITARIEEEEKLRKLNELMIGREIKMTDLKGKVSELEAKLAEHLKENS